MLTPQNIWNEAQNKPSLVVQDLVHLVPADMVYETLLRRGVFKWLAVRRHLIRLKNIWKDRITKSINDQKAAKEVKQKEWLRGYRAALVECRAEVRSLCHSSRWQVPDFDKKAGRWLEKYRKESCG